MRGLRQAVFLDRDGVLNEAVVRSGKPYPPASAAELKIFADAASSLQRLKQAGLLLIVVTNQPDIARGVADRRTLDEINQSMRSQLPLDGIYVCEHDDRDGCSCRKPKPGLLFRAVDDHGIDLQGSFLVGDRWRDIEAGAAAGCQTIWIDRRYEERPPEPAPDARVESLADAATWILQHTRSLVQCGSPN